MATSSVHADADIAPFFIVGCPRSGTTLLQRMLNAHPDVAVAPETFFVRRFWSNRDRYGDLTDDAHLDSLVDDIVASSAFEEMGLDAEDFRARARAFSDQMGGVFGALLDQFGEARGASVVGEKTPNHVLHIAILHRWFPEAQFVHLVRDPRGVVNSWRSVPWSSGYRWRDAEVWVEYVSAGRQEEDRYGAYVRSLHFEDLVRWPEKELRVLCEFLGLRYDDRMLAFHEQEPAAVDLEQEPWKARAADPIDPTVADRWRGELSWGAQAQVEAVASAEMGRWSYDPEVPPRRRSLARLRVFVERPVWKGRLVLSNWGFDVSTSDGHCSSAKTLTLGFLHVGDREHGVFRYGRMLAAAARRHLDVGVREAVVEWGPDPSRHAQQLSEGIRALESSDVVHIQYNERVWGESGRALRNVLRFTALWDAAIVVTLHDVRDGYGPLSILRRVRGQSTVLPGGWGNEGLGASREEPRGRSVSSTSQVRTMAESAWKGGQYLVQEVANALATWRLVQSADKVLVCTHEEARRLTGLVQSGEATVIPHFVEQRPRSPSRAKAKERLGLEERRVLGMLGYIHRRKGYDLAVEALQYLPEDFVLLCVGRPGRDSRGYADELKRRATELGVSERFRMTGYVEEEDLDDYLAATDLALCPFREASASGSLATWIAAERPVLASDLPLFVEYNEIVLDAIATFRPFKPQELAVSARHVLEEPKKRLHRRLQKLRRALALSKIVAEHETVYRDSLGEPAS